MPRRKAAKKASTVRRSSVQVPIDNTISEQERKQKLEAFIADFENERESRLQKIRDDGEVLIKKVNSLFHSELLKIPKPVREMKFVEFRDKYACDVNLALLQSTRAELDKMEQPASIREGRKTKKKTAATFETIDEETTLGRVTRTAARKKPVWTDTPLVTPAFNPRLLRAADRDATTARVTKTDRCTFLFDSSSSPKIEIPVNGKNVVLSKDSELTEESRSVLEDISRMVNTMLAQ